MKLAMQVKSPAGKLVEKMMALQSDPRTLMNNIINEKILTATSSKRLAFKSINPDLKVHPMYSDPMICKFYGYISCSLPEDSSDTFQRSLSMLFQ